MLDWNLYIILLNAAYMIWLAAFVAPDIVWLRALTITGNIVVLPYYLYFFEKPLWNPITWVGIYTTINVVMLFLLYLERRPVKLSEAEQRIWELTFKSLEPRVFKKLLDQGVWDRIPPHVELVARDSDLDNLLLVVEGEAEVVLRNGEHRTIPTGGFIGEQSFITSGKTSADVSTGAEATTILRWNKQALRKYLGHHEVLKHTFDLILTADLIYKLRNMDRDEQEIVNSRI